MPARGWRRVRLALAALAIALAPMAATSQEEEWRDVNEPAKLVFAAPGLTWAPGTSVAKSEYGRAEWLCWGEFRDRTPNACVTYQKSSGTGWTYDWVSGVPGWAEPFEQVTYDFVGKTGSHQSVLGKFDTRRLTVRAGGNSKNCVVFSRYFSGNTKFIKGWYCAAVGNHLESPTIVDIISTIGVTGIEVPADQPRFAERRESAQERSDSPTRREEAAHWNRIKDYTNPTYFQIYVSRYPNGLFADLARSRLAALAEDSEQLTPNQKADIAYWNRIKNYTQPGYFQTYLKRYPNGRFAALARSKLAALEGERVASRAADTAAPVIEVPTQVDTDQAVIDLAGRVADDSNVVELTLNGRAIALGSGGAFRVQRAVPLGTSEVRIAALDEWGNRAETRVVINRAAAETEPEDTPPAAIEVDPMDEQYVTARNANVRAAPTTDSEKLTTLGAGTTVTVTGKVKGADWFRVERAAGGEGYVFATLLTDRVEARVERVAPPQVVQAVLPPPDMGFGRYHALVIGANDYRNLPKLKTAVNDASAVADVLRQRYGFTVTLLLNPTRAEVVRALDALRSELTLRDNLLVYYAGHGFLDTEADTGYWQPVDAEEGTSAD